ncbi:MAG: hypothetical protein WC755_07005 [Candidatus Woesearchaeota archaeon]
MAKRQTNVLKETEEKNIAGKILEKALGKKKEDKVPSVKEEIVVAKPGFVVNEKVDVSEKIKRMLK